MTQAPLPPPYDQVGTRPFSFYPPVLNVEHNEWHFGKATWSELQAINSKTGQEVWIPRRFLGDLSAIDEPVLIVGLNKELEFRAGTVWPHQRRVIEMPPSAVIPPRTPSAASEQQAPVVGIRLEPGTESKVGKLILAALIVVAIALCAVVLVNREGDPVARVTYTGGDQAFLDLRYSDDYHSVVQKLGQPTSERWRENSGEIQYRVLWYAKRGYYAVFMGTDRKEMRYIGALDKDWKLVHFVQRPDGRDTASLLRSLKKF